MLGQLSWDLEANSGLDLSGGQRVRLVVANELAGLCRDLVEHVVDEGVHHGHAAGGDAHAGVNLLQHLVDVGGVRLLAGLALLLALSGLFGDFGRGLGDGLGRSSSFGGHSCNELLFECGRCALKYCWGEGRAALFKNGLCGNTSHRVPRN